MNFGQLRQSKRIRGIAASPEREVSKRVGQGSELGVKPKVPTGSCVDAGTQTSPAVGHSASNLESQNLVKSVGAQTQVVCNYQRLRAQQRPWDSGIGEKTVVEPASTFEEVSGRERVSTYPLALCGESASRGEFVESVVEGTFNAESLQWDSGDLREIWLEPRHSEGEDSSEDLDGLSSQGRRGLSDSSEDSPGETSSDDERESSSEFSSVSSVPSSVSPLAMAQRAPVPQLKYRAPPIFCGKKDENAVDCLERYESTAQYNRWEGQRESGKFWDVSG
ncbi:hypothetical protein GHT06_011572 [Daphnia sinensis]|uniref:Uncharacterized protein n=1 Tax=Daphnia sinensis TaxID=1820382 RepID=A0AAD5PWD1_9CRUS|nr:hypothetical protein GHT06_011572 [Daphnia sinensis]